MVKYIIEEPFEFDSSERKFKYPFISCEFLSSNVEIVLEQFFFRKKDEFEEEEDESDEFICEDEEETRNDLVDLSGFESESAEKIEIEENENENKCGLEVDESIR